MSQTGIEYCDVPDLDSALTDYIYESIKDKEYDEAIKEMEF